MHKAHKGDVVLVNGQKARVTDEALQDDLIRVMYPDRKCEYVMQSQVQWNYTEIENAVLDSELMQDYT